MDEMIAVLRGLGSGDYFEFHGKHFDIPAIKLCPVPTKPIPILIGGHADAALKRAARLSDGWMHGGGKESLNDLLAKLHRYRKEAGTDKKPFEIHVISMDGFTLDGVKRLEEQGITDVIVGFRNAYETDNQTLQQKLDALRGYAERVIQKL
jgi:alkanesulfonate monooxygenase SsuD/methylene tetrahydromethanopterin reductase-like flavin-dependent oxidoreductase (luciferase family)